MHLSPKERRFRQQQFVSPKQKTKIAAYKPPPPPKEISNELRAAIRLNLLVRGRIEDNATRESKRLAKAYKCSARWTLAIILELMISGDIVVGSEDSNVMFGNTPVNLVPGKGIAHDPTTGIYTIHTGRGGMQLFREALGKEVAKYTGGRP